MPAARFLFVSTQWTGAYMNGIAMRIDVDQKRVEVECNWDLGSRREAAAKAVEKGAKEREGL